MQAAEIALKPLPGAANHIFQIRFDDVLAGGATAGIYLDNTYFEGLNGDPITQILKRDQINYVPYLDDEQPVLPAAEPHDLPDQHILVQRGVDAVDQPLLAADLCVSMRFPSSILRCGPCWKAGCRWPSTSAPPIPLRAFTWTTQKPSSM